MWHIQHRTSPQHEYDRLPNGFSLASVNFLKIVFQLYKNLIYSHLSSNICTQEREELKCWRNWIGNQRLVDDDDEEDGMYIKKYLNTWNEQKLSLPCCWWGCCLRTLLSWDKESVRVIDRMENWILKYPKGLTFFSFFFFCKY